MPRIIYNFDYSIPGIEKKISSQLFSLMSRLDKPPVIVCLGSDKYTVDCLGPVCGELLTRYKQLPAFVYGTLKNPITARNIDIAKQFIQLMHPNRKILVIDAGVGSSGEFGLLKLVTEGLMAGNATQQQPQPFGDLSILGVVAERTFDYNHLLCSTKLNSVLRMAGVITRAVVKAFDAYNSQNREKINDTVEKPDVSAYIC